MSVSYERNIQEFLMLLIYSKNYNIVLHLASARLKCQRFVLVILRDFVVDTHQNNHSEIVTHLEIFVYFLLRCGTDLSNFS